MNENQETHAGRTAALVGSGPLVRCFCVRANGALSNEDVIAYGCDEDGNTLASHYCSNEGYARSDILRMGHETQYAKRYPEGYRTEWVSEPPANWDRLQPNSRITHTEK
jgi:hypothetical protein